MSTFKHITQDDFHLVFPHRPPLFQKHQKYEKHIFNEDDSAIAQNFQSQCQSIDSVNTKTVSKGAISLQFKDKMLLLANKLSNGPYCNHKT